MVTKKQKKTPQGLMNTKDLRELYESTKLNMKQFSEQTGHSSTWLRQRLNSAPSTPLYPRTEAKLVDRFPRRMREYFEKEYIDDLKVKFPEVFNINIEDTPAVKGKVKRRPETGRDEVIMVSLNDIKMIAIGSWVTQGKPMPEYNSEFVDHLIKVALKQGGKDV